MTLEIFIFFGGCCGCFLIFWYLFVFIGVFWKFSENYSKFSVFVGIYLVHAEPLRSVGNFQNNFGFFLEFLEFL
jgi:hypothetical protein